MSEILLLSPSGVQAPESPCGVQVVSCGEGSSTLDAGLRSLHTALQVATAQFRRCLRSDTPFPDNTFHLEKPADPSNAHRRAICQALKTAKIRVATDSAGGETIDFRSADIA